MTLQNECQHWMTNNNFAPENGKKTNNKKMFVRPGNRTRDLLTAVRPLPLGHRDN